MGADDQQMGRIRTFLHRDANEAFEQLAVAELKFARRHPWTAHGLWVLCMGASFAALWAMAGLRMALIIFTALFVLYSVVTMLAFARMRRSR